MGRTTNLLISSNVHFVHLDGDKTSKVPTLQQSALHYGWVHSITWQINAPSDGPWRENGWWGARWGRTEGPNTQTPWSESMTMQHRRHQMGMTDRQTDRQTLRAL